MSNNTHFTDSENDGSANEAEFGSHDTSHANVTGYASPSSTSHGMDVDGFEHHAADAAHTELHGTPSNQNAMQGSDGDDLIIGGTQNDVLEGGNGSDDLSAGDGDDVLVGGGSLDTGVNQIDGGAGTDILIAGGQKTHHFDAIFGASQVLNTTAHGDAKYADVANILDGALGNSQVQVENDFHVHSNSGSDFIFNFHASSDKIVIDRGVNGSNIYDTATLFEHVSLNGNLATVDLGSGNSVTLVGVDASSLTASNFLVV